MMDNYTSNEETFFSNSKVFTSELLENLTKCFLGSICKMICSACSNLQTHIGVCPVAEGLSVIYIS